MYSLDIILEYSEPVLKWQILEEGSKDKRFKPFCRTNSPSEKIQYTAKGASLLTHIPVMYLENKEYIKSTIDDFLVEVAAHNGTLLQKANQEVARRTVIRNAIIKVKYEYDI